MSHRVFAGVRFNVAFPIQPQMDGNGTVIEYEHSLPADVRGNRHAAGPFCSFQLEGAPREAGVYAITSDDALVYVGECANLRERFGASGYGRISPRNCHHDGQSTNCKINARILKAFKRSQTLVLWFHASSDYKVLEARILAEVQPPWNDAKARTALVGKEISEAGRAATDPAPPAPALSARREGGRPGGSRVTAAHFESALKKAFAEAGKQGTSRLRVRAGDLHRYVGDYPGRDHRMPVCCRVMTAAMGPEDTVLQVPPKGQGASLVIEYGLPRPTSMPV